MKHVLNKHNIKKKLIIISFITIFITTVFAIQNTTLLQADNSNNDFDALNKVRNTTTLEDNFVDNVVGVVLNRNATFSGKVYLPSSFPEIDAIYVEESTQKTTEIVNTQIKAEESGALSRMYDLTNGETNSRSFQPLSVRHEFAQYSELIPFIESNKLFDLDTYRRILRITLSVNCKQNVLDAIRLLEERDDILTAFVDYIPEGPMASGAWQDVTYIDQQWAVDILRLPEVWDITTGSRNIYVGVMDTGILANHPELSGLVCMERSKSFAGELFPALTDHDGHGTHVASTIASNWLRVAGVNRNVTLVDLRVMNDSQNIQSWLDVEAAVIHGTWWRLDIINMSMDAPDHPGLRQAIINFEGLFVIAAGNGNANNDRMNRLSNNRLDNLITVGASTYLSGQEVRANYRNTRGFWRPGQGSNWSATRVCIFAPGDAILSAFPRRDGVIYRSMSGTSMAAPIVSGVAALMLSVNRNLTPAQIRTIMIDTVHKAPNLNNLSVSNGRLDAYAAVRTAMNCMFQFDHISGTNNVSVSARSGITLLGNISIPETVEINGRIHTVTQIAENGFRNTGISQITIPQSVTRIGNNAFLHTSLLKVTIPRNVTHIGDYAFANIMNFNELIFESESNLEEIGRGAFRDNHILKHIEVPSGVRSIGLGAFQGNTGLESISIPFAGSSLSSQSNTHFGFIFGAFNHQTQNNFIPNRLRTVTITGNSTIFDYAFYGCENITTVDIPDDLTKIGVNAFSGTASLRDFFRNFVLDLRVNGIDAQTGVEVSRTGELLPINSPDNNEAFHNPLLRNNYTWISADPSILEVNLFGVLIGRSVGRTTVLSIYNNNQRWRAIIEVEVILLNNGEPIFLQYGADSGGRVGTEVSSGRGVPVPIGINPIVSIHQGFTRVITLGSDSPTLDVNEFNWFSGNTNVATVSSDGVVTAIRFGSAIIEGTYKNNAQFVVRIVVSVICVNHVFIIVEPGDHNWHVKICECGYMMNEPHSFTQFGNLMVCTVCGHVIQLQGWFMLKEDESSEA